MTRILHDGRRSWWDGTFHSACGLVFPQGASRVIFARTNCPGCLAARKAGKR